MRYMMFIKHSEDYRPEDVPQSLYEAMGEFVGRSQKEGTFIDGAGLQPSARGHRVRLSKGMITVLDGPFTESKEIVGGYALIEARSEEHALEIAREFMEIHRRHWPAFEGESEVRPLDGAAADNIEKQNATN
jgi:hypothetical protein